MSIDEQFYDTTDYFFKHDGVHCELEPEKCESQIQNLEQEIERLKQNDKMLTDTMKTMHKQLASTISDKAYCEKKQEELKLKIESLQSLKMKNGTQLNTYLHASRPAGHA